MGWPKAWRAVAKASNPRAYPPDSDAKLWLVLTWLQLALIWGVLIFIVLRLHDANDMVESLEATVQKMQQELEWEWEE